MSRDDYATRTIEAIGHDAYRDEPGPPVPLDETSATLGRLSVDAMTRLVAFLRDLAERPPLAGPAWVAHRDVIESLASDIEKYRTLLYYDELHK